MRTGATRALAPPSHDRASARLPPITVRMITTTNSNLTWNEAHVCYWNGSSYSSLGSVTGLGHVLDTAQVETATITGASAGPTYASSHRLYYVLIFDATGAHGSANANFKHSAIKCTYSVEL